MAYQSLNPYDGQILRTFEELTDEQLETALHAATACFDSWRHTTFAERTTVLRRAAALLRSRVEEFARPITLEMGKLIDESRGEVGLSADIIDYYADNAERFLAPQRLTPASGEATIESSSDSGRIARWFADVTRARKTSRAIRSRPSSSSVSITRSRCSPTIASNRPSRR